MKTYNHSSEQSYIFRSKVPSCGNYWERIHPYLKKAPSPDWRKAMVPPATVLPQSVVTCEFSPAREACTLTWGAVAFGLDKASASSFVSK